MDVLRKKMRLPLRDDRIELGQDANGCFEQMCKCAGHEPIHDWDAEPDEDVLSCDDPDLSHARYERIHLSEANNAWDFTVE